MEDMTALLMENLPGELLKIEETSTDGQRLPALRYAGREGGFPPGTGFPHAFIEVSEGEYTEKDRIVRNVVYTVKIQVKLADYALVWRYFRGIEEAMQEGVELYRIKLIKKKLDGKLWLDIVLF